MKIGMPEWNDRISPVFDTAKRLLVIEYDASGEVVREEYALNDLLPPLRVRRLKEIGVELLICGAISNPIACLIDSAGIELIPWVSGNIDDVCNAFRHQRLAESRYRMPGCRRGGRRFQGAMHGVWGRGVGHGHGRGGWRNMKGDQHEDSSDSDR